MFTLKSLLEIKKDVNKQVSETGEINLEVISISLVFKALRRISHGVTVKDKMPQY